MRRGGADQWSNARRKDLTRPIQRLAPGRYIAMVARLRSELQVSKMIAQRRRKMRQRSIDRWDSAGGPRGAG